MPMSKKQEAANSRALSPSYTVCRTLTNPVHHPSPPEKCFFRKTNPFPPRKGRVPGAPQLAVGTLRR